MDLNDISTGLTIVGLAALCLSLGFQIKRMQEIQVELLKCLAELAEATVGDQRVQTVPVPNWRELPPDGQLMMRQALVQVLAEMDRELPSRN